MSVFNSSHPIVSGTIMGVTIGVMDMALRPRLSVGIMEVFMFMVEGAVCYGVYAMLNPSELTSYSWQFDGKFLKNSAVAGLVVWLTDFFVKPAQVSGPGAEYVKFLIQGMIVYFSLAATQ